MIRQHKLIESLQPIFHAPLTEGDLTDHISGQTLIANSGSSYEWDINEASYKFSITNSTENYTGIQFPSTIIELTDNLSELEFTTVIDLKVDSSVLSSCQMSILASKYYYWKMNWYGNREQKSQWIRLSTIKLNGETVQRQYQDGILKETVTQNPVTSWMNTYLFARPSWASDFIAYAKNAYIFDKALTLEQIAAL